MMIKQHLQDRHVKDFQGIILGDECAYFIMYTLTGKIVGVQRYNPDGSKAARSSLRKKKHLAHLCKYLTYVSKGELGVWGLHSYSPYKPLYLTEGPFDAVMVHNLGLSAIATISNNPKHLKEWLNTLPNKLIAVCDNDEAGKKLAGYADKHYTCPKGKDLNDMTYTEIKELLNL